MNVIVQQLENKQYDICLNTLKQFLQENEKVKNFNKEYIILFRKVLNSISELLHEQSYQELKFKLFQLMRILTRSQEISLNINEFDFIILLEITQILQKQHSTVHNAIQIENLSIQKRLIFYNNKLIQCFQQKNIHSLLDLTNQHQKELLITLLDFLKLIMELNEYLIQNEISSLYYVGKLLVLLESIDQEVQILTTNLITKLLDNNIFAENFRKLTGMANVIQELERKQNEKLEIKIPLFNLLLKISSDNKNFTDLKMYGIIELLLSNLNDQNYMVIATIINILGQLSFDDELSGKIMQKGIQKIIELAFSCHPHKIAQLQFQDINKKDYNKAILELEIYIFRLLRYLASQPRHRHQFKQIFIPRVLQQFMDIQNFNKNINAYQKLVEDFNQIDPEDLLCMQETLQVSAENFYQQLQTKKIGEYEILEQIGKGAFGSVYLCKLGTNYYAIKQINDVETLQYREAQIHSELNHPNIVKLYEYFIYEHSLCLVMEYVKGMNVQELIKIQNEKNQNIEEEQIWKIIVDLLSVLRYLHCEKNIVHRDLNPANIMVDSNFSIKLCDFGLAKHFSDEIINNSFVGTLIYTCPQIVENKNYSEKADIWALGCILYEILQQKPAFQSANPLMLAKKIVELEYEPIIEGTYSNELIEIVNQCLQKDEQKRPSVQDLLQKISLRIVLLMDNIKLEKEEIQDKLLDLQQKLFNQKDKKKENQEPSKWTIFQKLMQFSFEDTKIFDAKNYFIIDQFKRKISKQEIDIQLELTKLTQLSKEFIPYMQKITYEQLFFIIDTEFKQHQF